MAASIVTMAARIRHRAEPTRRHVGPSQLRRRPVASNRGMMRRRVSAFVIAFGAALAPASAWAHGTVTGIEDVWQDYGDAIFLTLVVIVGAGVLIWVLLAPLPVESPDEVSTQPHPSNLNEPRRIDHEHGRAP